MFGFKRSNKIKKNKKSVLVLSDGYDIKALDNIYKNHESIVIYRYFLNLSDFVDYLNNDFKVGDHDAIICDESNFNFDITLQNVKWNFDIEDYENDVEAKLWTLFFDNFQDKLKSLNLIFFTNRRGNVDEHLFIQRLNQDYDLKHVIDSSNTTEKIITKAIMSE